MDTLQRGEVILRWAALGEGWNGDYNPDDPEDEELLRFDAFIEDHEWEDDYPTYSYCTMFPASATPEQRQAGLEYLMLHLYPFMSKGEWCRDVAEELSWINLGWLEYPNWVREF